MTLVPCNRCQRHVRVRDRLCPFCAHVAGALFGLGALVACKNTEPAPSEVRGVPSASAAAGLGTLSGDTAGRAAVYGSPPSPDSPRAVVTLDTPGASDVDERIVSAMRPGMRRCAQLTQDKEPKVAGTAQIQIQVAANGTVTSAKESGKGSLPADEVSCMTEHAKRSVFEPGSARTITVKVRHSQQE